MLALSRAATTAVVTDPFPHLVIDDALPAALADELASTFPPRRSFTRWKPYASNQKLLRFASDVTADPAVGQAWKAYFAEIDRTALRESMRLFGAHICDAYPGFAARFGPPEGLRQQPQPPRGAGPDVYLDSMLLLHTPVTDRPSVERAPHVKITQDVVLGYLTLRAPLDTGAGGDLVLYAPRPGARLLFHERQTVDEGLLEVRRVIPRRHNSLVLFVNTPLSIQGVSARPVTPHPLIAHHFALRLGAALFELPMAPGVAPIVPSRRPSLRRTLQVLGSNARSWMARRPPA